MEATNLLDINVLVIIIGFELFSPSSTLDESILPKIRQVFKNYSKAHNKELGLLQFWAPGKSSSGTKWMLKLTDEHLVLTENHKKLIRYRKNCLDNNCRSVGRDEGVGNWFAGRASQTGIADHRTKHLVLSPEYQKDAEAQGMGQLVIPVYSCGPGGNKKPEGIIELITYEPKESYVQDFDMLKKLLENEYLTSTFIGKTIKVKYLDHLLKFPLPYSATLKDLHSEVTRRMKEVDPTNSRIEYNNNLTNFRIEYEDTNGCRVLISSDKDLENCMAESSSKGRNFVRFNWRPSTC